MYGFTLIKDSIQIGCIERIVAKYMINIVKGARMK